MITAQHRITAALLGAGVAGALVVPIAVPAQAAQVDLEARMHSTVAFPHAGGYAEYESVNGVREFDLFISGVRTLAGKRLTVRVHGDLVGRVTVGPGGRAHLDRHSGVPTMSVGNVVRVRTPAGRLVAYGVLHRDTD